MCTRPALGLKEAIRAYKTWDQGHCAWDMQRLGRALDPYDKIGEQDCIGSTICILQNCRKNKSLKYAKHAHLHVCNNEMESHKSLGNYIVTMFMTCGSIFDAQMAFNKLLFRDEHCWTSLMQGYIQCGQSQNALSLYEEMQKDTICPSIYTLTALLQACGNEKDIESGKQIHMEIGNKGFEIDAFVGSTLVDMYCKCGSLLEARQVFDKLPVRNVVSWTVLINGYARHSFEDEALKCFDQMELEGIFPNAVTFVCSLKVCNSIGAIKKGREIHTGILQMGLAADLAVGNMLIDMYAKIGSLSEAEDVFDTLPVRNVVTWTTLINGYVEYGSAWEALKCFEQMQQEGIPPNATTFACSLKACGSIAAIDGGQEIYMLVEIPVCVSNGSQLEDKEGAEYPEIEDPNKGCVILKALEKGRKMHIEVVKKGLDTDNFVGNALIDMYVKCGALAEAYKVFKKLPIPDVVSWNTLITGYTEHGLGEKALELFKEMQVVGVSLNAITFICSLKACGKVGSLLMGREVHTHIIEEGFQTEIQVVNTLIDMYIKCGSLTEAREVFDKLPVRDVVSWNVLIAGYTESGLGDQALRCFEKMHLECISPNAITFINSLKACGNFADIGRGRHLHVELTEQGFLKDLFVGNSLLAMYVKTGFFVESREAFNTLPVRDIASWNMLMAGYGEDALAEEVLKCLERIQLEGISPNTATFMCCLKACGSLGNTAKARSLHTQIACNGLDTDLPFGNILIGMYARCGSLQEAKEVFDRLPARDVGTWNAIIVGYVENGGGLEALTCLKQMELDGTPPNAETFAYSLKACGSIGAINKGREIQDKIAQHGFETDSFVKGALIDMFLKCGSLREAREVFDKMPIPDAVAWTSLIGAYVEHELSEEALVCFEKMQLEGLCPDVVTFVCSLRACAHLGDMCKGREIHVMAAEKGLAKDVFVGTTLVDMYIKGGLIIEAQEVFDSLLVRNVVTWNALLAGYAENELGLEVLEGYEQMKLEGVYSDAVTFVCRLRACGSILALDKGRQIHAEICQKGYGGDSFVANTLLDMYAKCGALAEACQVFDKIKPKSMITWTAMIRGYGINHEGEMAVCCFEDMQEQGVKPDTITFICLLTACGRSNLVHKGWHYFKTMRYKHNITPVMDHYLCMADLFARSGCLYEAQKLLEAMPCPSSEEAWRALLSACRSYGEAEVGLRCFQQLIKVNPANSSSYVLMANIYANDGNWNDAITMDELDVFSGLSM